MRDTKIQIILNHLDLDEEPCWFIDAIGEIPYVALPSEQPHTICFSEKIEELSGYNADDILTNRQLWINMIHPDDRERVFAALTKCRNEGTPFKIAYRIVHRNNSLFYISDKGEPVFNAKGQIIQIEGVISVIGRFGRIQSIPVSRVPKVMAFSSDNLGVLQKI